MFSLVASSTAPPHPKLPSLSPTLCFVHFGRFIWLELCNGTRMSDNLSHFYNSFCDIVPVKWGVKITSHVHRMDEFICGISADLSGLGYTAVHDWVKICPTYTAVSTILFLRIGAVTLLRMCIEWTNSFVYNLFAPAPVPAEFAWNAVRGKKIWL